MKKHMIPFAPTQEGDKELIDLAFSKKKADDRKEWLRQFKVCRFACRLWTSIADGGLAGNLFGSSTGGNPLLRLH